MAWSRSAGTSARAASRSSSVVALRKFSPISRAFIMMPMPSGVSMPARTASWSRFSSPAISSASLRVSSPNSLKRAFISSLSCGRLVSPFAAEGAGREGRSLDLGFSSFATGAGGATGAGAGADCGRSFIATAVMPAARAMVRMKVTGRMPFHICLSRRGQGVKTPGAGRPA